MVLTEPRTLIQPLDPGFPNSLNASSTSPNFSQNSAALTRRASSVGSWAPFKEMALRTERTGTEYALSNGESQGNSP